MLNRNHSQQINLSRQQGDIILKLAIIGEIGIDSIIKGFKEGAKNIFRNIPCLMR